MNNAAGALASLASQHADNRSAITKRMVAVLSLKAPPQRACRLLSAVSSLCDNEPTNQVALAKAGGVQHLITWLGNNDREVQIQAARALLAVSCNNATTQSLVGKLGGVSPLIALLTKGLLEAQEHACCCMWHLASPGEAGEANRQLIYEEKGIPPLVSLLLSDSELACELGAMTLIRLAESSSRCAVAIAKGGGIAPLVRLVINGRPSLQQNAASCLAAITTVASNRDSVANAGGVTPLIRLLTSNLLGTPETAARALAYLARDDGLDSEHQRGDVERVGHGAGRGSGKVGGGEGGGGKGADKMKDAADGEGKKSRRKSKEEKSNRESKRRSKAGASSTNEDGGGTGDSSSGAAKAARLEALEAALEGLGGDERDKNEASSGGDGGEIANGGRGGKSREDAKDMKDGDDYEPVAETQEQQNHEGEDEESSSQKELSESGESEESEESDPESDDDDEEEEEEGEDEVAADGAIVGGAERRACILAAGGVMHLISMLDGSNIPGFDSSSASNGSLWGKARVGVAGTIEAQAIFPGSQVDFGTRIGMQEQAAATLSELAFGDSIMQDAIIEAGGVPPLLNLVNVGSPEAQEHSARCLWYLAEMVDNQITLVRHGAIRDLVLLLKHGSGKAQEAAAAGLSDLARGSIIRKYGDTESADRKAKEELAAAAPQDGAEDGGGSKSPSKSASAATSPAKDVGAKDTAASAAALATDDTTKKAAASPAKASTEEAAGGEATAGDVEGEGERESAATLWVTEDGTERNPNRLQVIAEVGGIVPLVKLAEHGSAEGKEKAAAALWHLALDPENRASIAANGGIKPLVSLLESGTEVSQKHSSNALTRLATDNSENQAQIAKRLVGLLDHDDASVVSRAAHDLQALAQDHPGAPVVIVNAGAISPLVTVLSNGKTDEGRTEAAKTLGTLANSGPANQLAIAIGLVALLGAGTDDAQEHVTHLLLTLSSGLESNPKEALYNRRAIANAGPFRMLVFQLKSESPRVRMLAVAVMAKLSGDSIENVTQIERYNGIRPLVALLDADHSDAETQANAASVLADITRSREAYANSVAKEGGIPLLVALLTTGRTVESRAEAAGALGALATGHAREVGDAGAVVPLIALLVSRAFPRKRSLPILHASLLTLTRCVYLARRRRSPTRRHS